MYFFCNRVLSYFAKPNFIVYDEWFDNDFKKTKLDFKNQKITKSSKIHEFFYEQSNHKVGASENNLQLEIKVNKKELFNRNHRENTLEKDAQLSIKQFRLFENLTKSKLKFKLTKKTIYSLSILGLVIFLGLLLFFISQSKKNESTLTNKLISLEKRF